MEREPGRLQLRINLYSSPIGTEGVCDVLVKEEERDVFVKVLVCWPEADPATQEAFFIEEDPAVREEQIRWMNCPYHVYLDAPLNGRTVRDMFTDGEPVPYHNVYEKLERELAQQERDDLDDIPF